MGHGHDGGNSEKAMGPEAKLYKKFKKATSTISWNRIENLAVPGMPDTLAYTKYNHFFTVEFKVTKSNKVRLSPHQVGWHMRILTTRLSWSRPRSGHRKTFSRVHGPGACSLWLELGTCSLGLEACGLYLAELGA